MAELHGPIRNSLLFAQVARVFGCVLGLLACAGCAGGQTGTEDQQETDTGGPARGEPPSSPCAGMAPPPDDGSSGFTVDEALALVNGAFSSATPIALDWMSGSSTDVAIDVAPTGVGCVGTSQGATELTLPVVVVVETADGRIDARIPGTIVARGTRGAGLSEVEIRANQTCDQGSSSYWGIACGVSGVDYSAYNGLRLEVAGNVVPMDAGAKAIGTLGVLGARGGGCVSTAPNSACSSPIWEHIETGSFGSP